MASSSRIPGAVATVERVLGLRVDLDGAVLHQQPHHGDGRCDQRTACCAGHVAAGEYCRFSATNKAADARNT